MFKTAKKRRFWRLTALPTTAAATAVHGGSWWLAGLFLSFSLMPCTLSLLLPWLPSTSPPFSLFSFSFSLWFSLGFPFLFFSFFPFFLSFLFSLGGFLVKSSNDLIDGWIHKSLTPIIHGKGQQNQLSLILSL